MKSPAAPEYIAPECVAAETEATGLPWPRTWRGVYWVVIGNFIFWAGLLVLLGGIFP